MKRIILILTALITLCTDAAAQFRFVIPYPAAIPEYHDTVTIHIIGDVMMHTRQLGCDPAPFLEDVSEGMKAADISILNMEFTLSGEPYTGYPCFSAPDTIADYLSKCGADLFLLANNHILDKGGAGLKRTLDALDARGIAHTGTGYGPALFSKKGIRIGFVNFTYGTNAGGDHPDNMVNRMKRSKISDMIAAARRDGADFIIALPHWGTEYSLRHDNTQEEWAGWLVGQGVDCIVGTHPHVVQDSTHIAGVPVFYSLGNAVSNMSAPNTRLELALSIKFVRDCISGEKKMLEPRLEFLWCTLPGKLTDSYKTVMIKKWANRRNDWLTPSDYDNMTATLSVVTEATGLVE